MYNVIYKCTVSQMTIIKQREWKQRYYNHTQSFRKARHKNDRAVSSYLWELQKKTSEIPKLTWPLLKTVAGYSYISKRCLSCLHENLYIQTWVYKIEKSLIYEPERGEVKNNSRSKWENSWEPGEGGGRGVLQALQWGQGAKLLAGSRGGAPENFWFIRYERDQENEFQRGILVYFLKW